MSVGILGAVIAVILDRLAKGFFSGRKLFKDVLFFFKDRLSD